MNDIKGKYVRKIVDDYCVLDFETTGLSFSFDKVIEIGIIRVRNSQIVDRFQQLINPNAEINEFVTRLTGITNEMVFDKPTFKECYKKIFEFVGDDLIIGHNTSFDMNFLYFESGHEFSNEYVDTFQFSRKIFPEMKHHRLKDMVEKLNLSNNEHRSISDCIATFELYEEIKNKLNIDNISLDSIFPKKNSFSLKSLIRDEQQDVDENSLLFNKHVCFTGILDKMSRKDAAKIVLNIGGFIDSSVTAKTNYLILGNNDYCSSIKDGKSSKHKKAESLMMKGNDINVIDEDTFYFIIDSYDK